MTSMHHGNIAIVGAAETTEIGVLPHMSSLDLIADAARNAIADAGLSAQDIDGIATAGPGSMDVSHHLGITPRWLDGTNVGGCSFMLHVRHAAAAIAAGAVDTVLIVHGESGRSRVGADAWVPDMRTPFGQFETVFGAQAAYSTFTLPVMGFLHDRGMTPRHLAHVVAAQRAWCVDNPRAFRRTPVTVDEVLASPMVAYPFTKDMCCVVTDAGGALVVTSAERARDLPSADRAVYLLGSGEASEGSVISQMADPGSSLALRNSSAEAFATAGVTPGDIDHLMAYDAFAHVPLYMLEDAGFVKFGESGDFVAEGNTMRGGPLPMNTNGGGMSYTHTGLYGMFAIQESIRQLRGEAYAQVEGLELGFVQGVGGFFAAGGSLVLSNVRP